jgi:Na+-driven multidrug efflux pump
MKPTAFLQAWKSLDKKTLLQIAAVAWPMAFNAMLTQSVSIVDLLLVASLGDVSVAAFGIGGAIGAFVLSVQMAIGQGMQLVLSRATGEGHAEKVGLEVACGWVHSVVFALAAVAILLLGAKPAIGFIAHGPVVAQQAVSYLQVFLLVIIFSSLCKVAESYFNASKKTRIPLYGYMLEIPINIVLSAALIHGLWGAPALGLAGAAWGSCIATFFRLMYLGYRMNEERLKGHIAGLLKVNRGALLAHFHKVFPVVANFIVMFTGMLVFQALFAQLSVASYAAITLVMPWMKIGAMFVTSWTQSSTILVSQKLGQQRHHDIPSLVMQSRWVTAVIMAFMMLGFFFFSLGIAQLYPGLSADTIAALVVIAPIYIVFPFLRVNNMFCGSVLNALGKSYLVVRISIVTQWLIAIPVCALLVYLEAPLVMVFGVILLDEGLKYFPVRKILAEQLAKFARPA